MRVQRGYHRADANGNKILLVKISLTDYIPQNDWDEAMRLAKTEDMDRAQIEGLIISYGMEQFIAHFPTPDED